MTVVFFTDRDLGSRFPEILAAAELTVERHRDHFAPDCADEVWLRSIGQRGWVALTHDRRIRYKPNELSAVIRHGVALLVIIGDAPYPDFAHAFVAPLARIRRFLTQFWEYWGQGILGTQYLIEKAKPGTKGKAGPDTGRN